MSATDRLTRLRESLAGREVDAILISAPENRRYVSGFTGSAGYLIVSEDDAVLATDFRYVEQAGRQAPGFRVERIGAAYDWLPTVTSKMGVRRLGFEAHDLTVATHTRLAKAIKDSNGERGPDTVPVDGVVEGLRAVKDPEEMSLLAKAVEIADCALDRVAPTIEAGVREKDVAWELERSMREAGAEAVSFDIIVGAGPNGALPHHRAGETVIGDGQPVVIDMGATYEGYCSDLTRTVFVGEPDERFREVYGTVLRAQLEAEERVEQGMTGAETDAIAREIISEAGYGDNFGHSLGHGVGLAVHESPGVGPRSGDPLENGMVFTVEPGIYLSGWGGVRIEDMVVLENGRARVLSKAHKISV